MHRSIALIHVTIFIHAQSHSQLLTLVFMKLIFSLSLIILRQLQLHWLNITVRSRKYSYFT